MTRWIAALLLALLAPALAHAQTFPKFTGLVVDDAGKLTAEQKAALEAKLEAFQQRTRRQLVVATIADLHGYDLADYGNRLLRAWGVGLKDVNNGAILFVAPNEPAGHRGPRIEVGYGLEPYLTDALASVIINRDMMPRLKAGDLAGALDSGTDAITTQLSLPDDEAKARVDAAVKQFDQAHRRGGRTGGVPLGLIFWGMVAAFVLLASLRRRAAGTQRYAGSGGGGGSNWPIWLWAASELMDGGRHRGGGWGGFGDGGGGGGWSDGGGGSDGSWGGGGFTGGGGGSGGGGGASGSW